MQGAATLSLMTLGIKTLTMKGLFATLSIITIWTECHYGVWRFIECHYAECRGAPCRV